MALKQTANEIAWRKILTHLPIAQALASKGWIEVSAQALKQWGEREPRLLVKWDTLPERPRCLVELSVSLLPIRNGHYLLFRDTEQKMFYRFSGKQSLFRPFASSFDLTTFDTFPGQGLSESQALDFAFLAGIFQDFTEDSDLRLTLRGRLFSGRFAIRLPGVQEPFQIDQVQIEIDAGYEGRKTLLLLEAKRGGRDAAHLRQLWFPFMAWRHRTQKQIRPVFFTYSNGKVQLDEFHFTDCFAEVDLLRTRAYALDTSPPPKISLSQLLNSTQNQVETLPRGIPFPQANDLDKWMDLLLWLASGPQDRENIAETFGIDSRQADYYANVGIFLGTMKRCEGLYFLTDLGMEWASLPRKSDRSLALLHRMACIDILRDLLSEWRAAKMRVESIPIRMWSLRLAKKNQLAESTALRRSESVSRWLEWFAENLRVSD